MVTAPSGVTAKAAGALIKGLAKGAVGSVRAEKSQIERHLATPESRPLMVSLTVSRPHESSTVREFDVLVNDHLVASKDHPGFLRWMLGEAGFPEERAAIAAVKARLATG